jgi:hypothetical protein
VLPEGGVADALQAQAAAGHAVAVVLPGQGHDVAGQGQALAAGSVQMDEDAGLAHHNVDGVGLDARRGEGEQGGEQTSERGEQGREGLHGRFPRNSIRLCFEWWPPRT